jgi:hypothetical protein
LYDRQCIKIVRAVRLFAGFSVTPVPSADLDLAQELIRDYFVANVVKFGPTFATYTNHNSVHFVEDLRFFGCHGDRSSTYDFETHHMMHKFIVQPGAKPHLQLM